MSSEREKTSRFTVHWLKAQPVLAGYVGAMVRDRAAADDIVQSVATIATEKFDTFDPEQEFSRWAIGIAKNRIYKSIRTKVRDRHIFSTVIVKSSLHPLALLLVLPIHARCLTGVLLEVA